MSYVDETMAKIVARNAHEPEFIQAVTEVLESLRIVIESNEEAYRRDALLERLTTPERFGGFCITTALSLIAAPILYPILQSIGTIGGEAWKE